MQPFLKWPGGKRWFVANHLNLLPVRYSRYIEPFLGAGTVFFSLQPANAILGDSNAELIAAYQGIRSDWQRVLKNLKIHEKRHCLEYYYRVRSTQSSDLSHCAARLIYLNRTCFNGIFRVNRLGKFNVPIGNRNTIIFPSDNFSRISKLLQSASLKVSDFELLIDGAKENDLIFADPPYTVRHNKNAFVKYNEKLFSWSDQVRLARALARAAVRGAHVVSTNANHPTIRELYKDRNFKLVSVKRFSGISASAENRKDYDEIVILSHSQNR